MSRMGELRVSERGGREVVEDAIAVSARLANADAEGFNSLDIARATEPSPLLSILTHGAWCVIHYADDPRGPMVLLENPSPDATPHEVTFRYLEGMTPFTHPYIHPLATAQRFITEFADPADSTRPAGTWTEL